MSDTLTVLLNTYFKTINRRILIKHIGDNELFEDVIKRLRDIQDAQTINRNYFSKKKQKQRNEGILQTLNELCTKGHKFQIKSRIRIPNEGSKQRIKVLQPVPNFVQEKFQENFLEVSNFQAGNLKNHNDKYILKIVKGYRIEFSDQPIQIIVPKNPYFNIQDFELIDEEINKMLKIRAIE